MAARSKNTRVRKQEYQHDYTAQEIQELKKCLNDPVYFIETYIRIQHPSRGAVNFQLYDYQKDLIKLYATPKDSIVLSSRQTGKCCIKTTNIKLKKISNHGIMNKIKKFILFIIDRRIYYDTFGKV
jgi:hypothetical protein